MGDPERVPQTPPAVHAVPQTPPARPRGGPERVPQTRITMGDPERVPQTPPARPRGSGRLTSPAPLQTLLAARVVGRAHVERPPRRLVVVQRAPDAGDHERRVEHHTLRVAVARPLL